MIPGSKQCDDMKARKEGTIPPFRPDIESEKKVRCEHCGETYMEKEIKWDKIRERWVCKNHPKCDGSVLRFDIRHID
jgi:ssDNA-binding Zn-finger/Zn-ribbon topoisomerase 1